MTRLGVDVGGTFTDVVALRPDGSVAVAKVPSARHEAGPDVWRAVSAVAPPGSRDLVHGTTIATNALIERAGARVVLLMTAGFEDLLELRRQERAALYDLTRHHPPALVSRVDIIGVAERMGPDGVLLPLTRDEIARVVAEVKTRQAQSVAITFLFSFRFPDHERAMAAALRAVLPEDRVAASSEVLPIFREYERASTTAAEAYLRPLVTEYLGRFARDAEGQGITSLRVMTSSGGALGVGQARRRAAQLALSGPAGGVEGARLAGAELGLVDLLTLDMGGTSADAGIVLDGRSLVQSSGDVAGVPLALPHVLIETVGAGGGSVAWVDAGGALRVGPRSAGADPGPACYGRGGEEATVTDAALVLGWLDAARPLASALRLDAGRAQAAVSAIAQRAGLSVPRCAEGIVEIATATMVRALRRVSVERGVDPRTLSLVAFGGAGPMFVCRLADAMAMRRAVVPPHAGVLSALGLAAAPERIERVAAFHRLATDDVAGDLAAAFRALEASAEAELQGAVCERQTDVRYPGQGYELTVDAGTAPNAAQAFHAMHHDRFGHSDPGRPVEIVNVRIVASRPGFPVRLAADGQPGGRLAAPPRGARLEREQLVPGERLAGPLAIDGSDATVRIEPGWTVTVHQTGALLLERA